VPLPTSDDLFFADAGWWVAHSAIRYSCTHGARVRQIYFQLCHRVLNCTKTFEQYKSSDPTTALSRILVHCSSHDSIAGTSTQSEVEMKYVDLVLGDPVGGQMYQFNARIGNLTLPFFFYCIESVCIK
jgi:hypothetical protein